MWFALAILGYLGYVTWFTIEFPFADDVGAERTPLVVSTAKTIKNLADGSTMEEIALLDLAISHEGLFDYALAGAWDAPIRPTAVRLEANAEKRKSKRMLSYCVGQAVFGASVATQLGLPWRLKTSVREAHAWIEVAVDGEWYALNAKEGHHMPPLTRLFGTNGAYDPRLSTLGYSGPKSAPKTRYIDHVWMFSGPTLAMLGLYIVARGIHFKRQRSLWATNRKSPFAPAPFPCYPSRPYPKFHETTDQSPYS